MTDKPLVSVCMMCFNQEAYIEEALCAALAQTYSPLEIVLSDDGSTDGGWEIINRIVAEYKGPHKVILNRNPRSLNVIDNFQKALSLSSGELIVDADGDDVSYPDRVERLVEDWVASGKKALMMCSSYDCVDETGRIIGEKVYRGGWNDRSVEANITRVFLGGAFAFHRSLYADFPPVTFRMATLDTLFHVRALLSRNGEQVTAAGKFRIVPKKLLKYRVNVGVSNRGRYYASRVRNAERTIEAYRQNLLDIDYLNDGKYADLRTFLVACIEALENTRTLYGTGCFLERVRALRKSHVWTAGGSKNRLVAVFALLPPRLRDFLVDRGYAFFQRTMYVRPDNQEG